MQAEDDTVTGWSRFQGTRQILQYNKRFYVAAPVGSAAAVGALASRRLPLPLKIIFGAAAIVTAFWTCSSIGASYYIYDHSELCKWQWIENLLTQKPQRWANIHAGLDESSLALRQMFPSGHNVVLDIYDAKTMTEPSIARARLITPALPSIRADYQALPLADQELDAIFLIMAAHEIREPDHRLRFFEELRRVLKPDGKLLLIEHPRDINNFAVFGPGFLHFLPRIEWLRLSQTTGFKVAHDFRITPFIQVLLLERV